MARFHFWGFIVNEAGEPIENAEVTIKLAGLDTFACLYFDEYGGYNTCDDPSISDKGYQLKTLQNGYYEFWVGDTTEAHGYRYDQKFKIEWVRVGVAYGEIDHVNILPLTSPTYPASLESCDDHPSVDMNKLVSDALVCTWDSHWRKIVENEVVHGIEYVDVDAIDRRPNKIISNELAWRWDKHRDSTVTTFHPSAGYPHDIRPVDILSPDTTRNKVVSNKDLHDLYVQMLKSYLAKIETTDWTYTGSDGLYEYNIEHNMDIHYPHCVCYDDTTHEIEKLSRVVFVDSNTIKILINDNTKTLWVRISGQHQ